MKLSNRSPQQTEVRRNDPSGHESSGRNEPANKTNALTPTAMKTRIHHLLNFGAAALLAITIAFTPGATLNAQPVNNNAEFVSDEVIVQFKTTASAQQLADALQRAALTVKAHLSARDRRAEDSGLVMLKTKQPVAKAVAALQTSLSGKTVTGGRLNLSGF